MNNPLEAKAICDQNHWLNLKPPLAPNRHEVALFSEFCKNRSPVLMLGLTKQLRHLCDMMVDLNKIEAEKPLLQKNWLELNQKAEVIIADGSLNLAGFELVPRMMGLCFRFVCRVFTRKHEGMKYANFFPKEFAGSKEIIPTQDGVVMVVYEKD
jgi:hypothetical protein